jgi:hypothetical protein
MSANTSKPSPTEAQKCCPCKGAASIVIWIVALLIIGTLLWAIFTQSGQETLGQISNKGFSNWLFGEGNTQAEQDAAKILAEKGVIIVDEKEPNGITSVNFTNCLKPDDATVKQVASLFRLGAAILANTEINDDQLAYFGNLKHMTSLVINGTPITDAGLAQISNLPMLQTLQASHTKISDNGLDHIVSITTLKVLDLSNTNITDKGMKKIAQLKDINWLLLRGTKITDAGLAELAAIPELKHLSLSEGMNVSNGAIEKLKQALPSIVIDFEKVDQAQPKPAAEEPKPDTEEAKPDTEEAKPDAEEAMPAAEETKNDATPAQPAANGV